MMKILVPRGHREKGKMGEDKMKKWKITDEGLATFKEITTNDRSKSSEQMMVDYNSLEAYMIEHMEKCFKVIKIKKNNLHIRTKNEYQNTVSSLTAIYKQGKIQRKIVKMYIDVLSKANKEEVSLQRSTELAERIKQLSIDDELSLDSFWKLKKSCVRKNRLTASGN